jgi:hypothetical protein
MSQIFISHVNVDQDVAIKIATGFEGAGYSTWYYERDSLPGPSYIDQISDAIDNSQTMMVLFSPTSVVAPEVIKEIEQAYLQRKPIIPVLHNITHKEVHTYKKLSQMLGTATDICVPLNGVDDMFVRRLVAGLVHMGIVAEKTGAIDQDQGFPSFADDRRGEIFRQVLIEAFSDGQINEEDQSKLNYMARMLQLSEDQVSRLMVEVQDKFQNVEIAEQSSNPMDNPQSMGEMIKFETSLEMENFDNQSEESQSSESFEILDDSEKNRLPIVSEEILLAESWRLPLDHGLTEFLEMSGDGQYIYRIDAESGLAIYDLKRNLCYQEHFSVPIYCVLAVGDGLVLGDWEGHVFVYYHDQIIWQASFNSPISALAFSGEFLSIGCWNGVVSIRKLSDGSESYQIRLSDAVSTLIAQEDGTLIAGDLAGNISGFDDQAQKLWSMQFPTAIMQSALGGKNSDQLLVLLKDDQLININRYDRSENWRHHFDQLSKKQFNISSSGKQIAFFHEKQFLIFRLGKDLKLLSSQNLPDGENGTFLPILQDGRFIGLQTSEGFDVADLYKSQIYPVYKGNLTHWCAASNGQKIATVDKGYLTLFTLTSPDLSIKLAPVTVLYQNRYSRLSVQINNHGKRIAKKIKIILDGEVKSKPYECDQDLLPGEQILTQDYSINVLEEGAIPLKVNVSYQDDFGIEYALSFDCILDVQAH